MDGRQKPDPQNERGNDLNDKDVIDLTEVVQGGDGYDVIELNDILEQPDQAAKALAEPAEEAIPLVNALPEEGTTDLPQETDDEIIDLMDVAAAPQAPAPGPAVEAATAPGLDEAGEEVIDLMDVADTLDADLVEAEPEVSAAMPEESTGTAPDEDDVIDLMDVANTPEGDTAGTALPGPDAMPEERDGTMQEDEPIIDLLEAVGPQAAEAETTVETDDEYTDLKSRADAILTGAEDAYDGETPEKASETAGPDNDVAAVEDTEAIIDETEAPAVVDDLPEDAPNVPEPAADPAFIPASPSEPVPLTEAQVEAALERTIHKIYGEKIEQLMIQAIEKTVKKEIERIKRALLEDDDDMIG
jgi:hypothetical protein